MSTEGILSEVENKLKEVNIEQTENTTPVIDEKPKKSKKKNKSKAAKTDENKVAEEKVIAEEPIDEENQENTEAGPVCAFCKKPGPTKRCNKKCFKKCMTKLFCNETCVDLAHENKKAAVAKVEAKKVAAAKKKSTTKVKNWKNTDSGQFWWHDQ